MTHNRWWQSIPEHWAASRIKGLTTPHSGLFTDGDWIETPYITNEGIRLIQTGNIGIGNYEEQGFRYISSETFSELNCTEIFPNDILICRLAEPVGRACLAPNGIGRMITSVDVAILRPQPGLDARYFVYVFSSTPYLEWLSAICRGSTRERISRKMLGDISVPMPSTDDQCAIANFLDSETSRIDAMINAKCRLIELAREKRGALISELVMRGLDPAVAMKDSGIRSVGQVPKHWDIARSRVLFREIDDRSPDGTEELLTVSHISGVTPRSAKPDVTMFMAESLEGYKRCQKDDLVINTMWAWMGALGISRQKGQSFPIEG